MPLQSAWIDGIFNPEIGRSNLKEFILAMENPSKIATRQQFEEDERAVKSVVEQRITKANP